MGPPSEDDAGDEGDEGTSEANKKSIAPWKLPEAPGRGSPGGFSGRWQLYSQESPEVWFEDVGEGQLVGGTARIEMAPLFFETVTINDQHPMKVFIQLNDDCNGVYVKRLTAGFQVIELGSGNSSAQFTYRVMAKRKGFENARLEAAGDPAEHIAKLKKPEK